jgi:hypothetical protein
VRDAAAQRPPRRFDGHRRQGQLHHRRDLDYCDRFFWAVPPHLARILDEDRYLPTAAGLIVADRYDAAVVRDALHRPLAPARRKAELLRFARRSARRLAAQVDPSLGDLS